MMKCGDISDQNNNNIKKKTKEKMKFEKVGIVPSEAKLGGV